ncbi:MAG TPA: hypothetical protein VMT03_14215 [Polyangia bacterium]|nr:hypothetical protein [Polyangia bacterium]
MTVDVEKSQGANVSTFFSASMDITCPSGTDGSVFVVGFVQGSESLTKDTGSPRTFTDGIFLEIDEYVNSCTGAFAFGFGGVSNGFLPPGPRLNFSKLFGSGTFQDFNSGLTYPFSLNLNIEGQGPISATKDSTVSRGSGPIIVTVSRSASATRSGGVTGTLSIDGIELNATFSSTSLSSNAASTITVQKN